MLTHSLLPPTCLSQTLYKLSFLFFFLFYAIPLVYSESYETYPRVFSLFLSLSPLTVFPIRLLVQSYFWWAFFIHNHNNPFSDTARHSCLLLFIYSLSVSLLSHEPYSSLFRHLPFPHLKIKFADIKLQSDNIWIVPNNYRQKWSEFCAIRMLVSLPLPGDFLYFSPSDNFHKTAIISVSLSIFNWLSSFTCYFICDIIFNSTHPLYFDFPLLPFCFSFTQWKSSSHSLTHLLIHISILGFLLVTQLILKVFFYFTLNYNYRELERKKRVRESESNIEPIRKSPEI